MNFKLWQKLLIPIVLLASTVFATAFFLFQHSLKQKFVYEEFLNTYETVIKNANRYFTDEIFIEPFSTSSQEVLKKFATDINDTSIARLDIVNNDYVTIFSDLNSSIGFRDLDNPYLKRIFETKKQFFVESSKENVKYLPNDTEKFISIYVPISSSGEIKGAVEIHKAYGSFLRPVEENIQNLAYILIIGLILIISIISYTIYRLILRPIRELKIASHDISAGKLDRKIISNSGDEIGDLMRDFDSMRQRLKMREGDMTQANIDLEKTSAELNENLIDLKESKRAMINLLEDAEILKEKLVLEKEGVEQKVIERTKELNEEKAKLLASINSLSFGFVIADLNDNIVVKNASLSYILELTTEPTSLHDIAESFIGTVSGLDVLSHKCRECIELKKVVALNNVSHGQKYLRVLCTPVIVKDSAAIENSENVIGYVVMIEDITEAKIMERSREEFFAVASHELRTPLTAIRGNADMILEMYADKIVDKDMKEMLQDIDISSIRLIAIVNDFLEVSRIEHGRLEIKKENFNVSDVVEKVIRDMKTIIEQKGLSLIYNPPSSPLPTVFADKSRAEQVIINLVGNATKFTKEGSITVIISVDGNFVCVRVIDTGIGISEHNQSLLFRKFQQAGEQMLARDVTQSTGLGLYISKLIVSSMGGTIGLEKSELGKGSTFIFTLPIAK